MRISATLAVAGLALVAGSCADAPTKPQPDGIALEQGPIASRQRQGNRAGLLKNIAIAEPLPGGGTFVGKVSILRLDYDEVSKLTATVELSGRVQKSDGGIMKTAGGRPMVIGKAVTIKGVPVALDDDNPNPGGLIHPAQAACRILFLDLGLIRLDLLGLVLDLSLIQIDLTGQPGAGSLLGNLLCALLGLLDPLAAIALIQQVLQAINNVLGAIGGGPPVV